MKYSILKSPAWPPFNQSEHPRGKFDVFPLLPTFTSRITFHILTRAQESGGLDPAPPCYHSPSITCQPLHVPTGSPTRPVHARVRPPPAPPRNARAHSQLPPAVLQLPAALTQYLCLYKYPSSGTCFPLLIYSAVANL